MNRPLAALDHVISGHPVGHAVALMLVFGLSARGYRGDQRDSR
jgi:hypothetical protein